MKEGQAIFQLRKAIYVIVFIILQNLKWLEKLDSDLQDICINYIGSTLSMANLEKMLFKFYQKVVIL